MKINIEIDVSPEEARHFFGLPDVAPIQDKLVERVQAQIEATSDPAYLGKLASQLVAGGVQSVDAFQRTFFDLVSAGSKRKGSKKNDKD
jgi:hypothetical protein